MITKRTHHLDGSAAIKKVDSSRRRSIRLGIAGQFRLIISIAVTICVLGLWAYVALTDAREVPLDPGAISKRFEQNSTVVVSLQNKPPHVDRVLKWLKAHYHHASFLVVDDDFTVIEQSEPPPPAEHRHKVASYPWDMALVLPLIDASGERFYVTVIQELPSSPAVWIDRFELIIPAFLIIVFLIATIALARRVLNPIRQVSAAAQAISAGALHQRPTFARNDELGDLVHAFNVMADRNADLLLTQKQLLAQVGHELRTPLARVRVALDIARERLALADAPQLHDVDRDLDEMARLISDILAVSRLETAQIQGGIGSMLRLEEVQLDALINEVTQRFATTFPDRQISPSVIESGELLGDRILLGRVLWNLLENAHKHSPPDTPIELSATFEDRHAIWVVDDAGDGIDPELIERVFEPFVQGRSRDASTMSGFGLGLSLCKRVVDAHSGHIALENRSDGGLSARVVLPLAPTTEILS